MRAATKTTMARAFATRPMLDCAPLAVTYRESDQRDTPERAGPTTDRLSLRGAVKLGPEIAAVREKVVLILYIPEA